MHWIQNLLVLPLYMFRAAFLPILDVHRLCYILCSCDAGVGWNSILNDKHFTSNTSYFILCCAGLHVSVFIDHHQARLWIVFYKCWLHIGIPLCLQLCQCVYLLYKYIINYKYVNDVHVMMLRSQHCNIDTPLRTLYILYPSLPDLFCVTWRWPLVAETCSYYVDLIHNNY